MSTLEVCPGCGRHIRSSASKCPFCRRPTESVRAELPPWVAALAAVPLLGIACASETPRKNEAAPNADGKDAKVETKTDAEPKPLTTAGVDVEELPPEPAYGVPMDEQPMPDPDADPEADTTVAEDTPRTTSAPPEGDAKASGKPRPDHVAKPKYGLARPPTKYGAPPPPEPDSGPDPDPDPDPDPEKDPFGGS